MNLNINKNLIKNNYGTNKQSQKISSPSFQGFGGILNKTYKIEINDNLRKSLDGRFPKMVKEFEKLSENLKLHQKFLSNIDDNTVKYQTRTPMGKAVDLVKFFAKDMWLDIMNTALDKARNTKFFKNNDTVERIYNSKKLKNHRLEKEAKNVFYTAVGLAEKFGDYKTDKKDINNLSELNRYLTDHINEKLSKPHGTYEAKSERALNRLATGTISAGFVGRDFYNVTMYQKDNDKDAKKSQRKRFKQEMTRISTSALLSFSVLGIFSRWTNKNKWAAIGTTALTTLFAEVFSRVKNGVSLVPLTSEGAKKIHDKNVQKGKSVSYSKDFNMLEFVEKSKNANNVKKENQIENKEDGDSSKNKSKSVLSNILKVAGALLVIGFAWDMLLKHGIKPLQKKLQNSNNDILKFIGNFKENITLKDRVISEGEMQKLLDSLKLGGNDELASEYTKYIESFRPKGKDYYVLGKKETLWAVPFKIPEKIMDVIKFPYNVLSKFVNYKMAGKVEPETDELDMVKKGLAGLYDSLPKKDMSREEIAKIINSKINTFFNSEEVIKYKQSDLAMMSRTFVTLIASYFFINDFRNQVLIDSEGRDTKKAKEVTNERIGHKLTNFVTNAFWMNLFNTTFQKTVMGSLLGATAVAAATELANETTIRVSIGVPLTKKKSKQEIDDFETKNYNNKGLYGKWIRLFSKLTGKKPISEKAKK